MVFGNLTGAILQWYRAWRDARTLDAFSDRDLDDIGLTRRDCGRAGRSAGFCD